jgi:glycosyltransferase involved in cell wall biosynthesis
MEKSACRVLIDGYFLEKPYGFGRFIGELCCALGRYGTGFEFVVAVPARVPVSELPAYPNLKWHQAPNANFMVWEQGTMPRLARSLSCDAIHFPYNTRAFYTHSIPTVTTVHDLLFLRESPPVKNHKDYIASQYTKWVFRTCTRRSKMVVSVSETTRKALNAFGIEARTVYNTVDDFVSASRRNDVARPASGRRYILHRGGIMAHRNTARVIEAFRAVRGLLPDVDLRVVGAPDGRERWRTTHDEDTIQFLPRVSDEELAALYAGSSCVLATSLEEGFGLPIIEGFGFGIPVITSDLDPMREVAGGAAVLVNPRNGAEIGSAVASILSNAALARTLVEKGRARMETFSSAHMAAQMDEVYGACIGPASALVAGENRTVRFQRNEPAARR